MKERPIIFNAEMVRAILESEKTQTRRVMKPQPIEDMTYDLIQGQRLGLSPHDKVSPYIWCPYGIPSDRLWLREPWRIASLPFDEQPCIQYKADMERAWCDPFDPVYNWDMKYEAWFERMNDQLIEDCERAGIELNINEEMAYTWNWESIPTRWRPSIHMPRWTSRIILEVTDVRVERVQDISYEDAVAEGIPHEYPKAWAQFRELWDSLNAKRGYGWDMNPWVFVVEFQQMKGK